jgi:predicted nucleic acid-binding protein
MPSEVLLDTAGLIAWAWCLDELHRPARQKWESLLDGGTLPVIWKGTLVESLVTLQKSIQPPSDGRQVAVLVGQQLRDYQRSDLVQFVDATEAQERDGWRIFEEAHISEMTLSDCLCVAIARRRRISAIFSPQPFFRAFGLAPLLPE